MTLKKTIMRRVATVGGVLAIGGLAALAAPTQAVAVPVNVSSWCHAAYGPSWNPVIIANNVYGWRCQSGVNRLGVNMEGACQYQYGSAAHASFSDYNNPYSWYCY